MDTDRDEQAMTDETGGKPLFCENARIILSEADLTELIAAAEECAGDLMSYVNAEISTRDRGQYPHLRLRYDRNIAPVDRLRAAVARVRGE